MTSRTPRRSRDITPAPRTRRYEGGQGGRDGACALLKHQAVSERGGGPLAAVPFVLRGKSPEVLQFRLALSELR